MCSENKTICAGTDAIKEELDGYCNNVIDRFNPTCIILYGSRAKGTFTNTSDIDIIVISNNFEYDFLSRIKHLIEVNESILPIEPLGYTETEFETMLQSCKITPLDAVKEGLALYGEDYFNNLKKKFRELQKIGLYKGEKSWHIPSTATG